MYYSPHILQVKMDTPPATDKYGRVIALDNSVRWQTICQCRCDDNTTTEFKSDNGRVFRPKYHIVCDGNVRVEVGDAIRCLNDDGTVRCVGNVYLKKQPNYYKYTEIWV